MMNRIDTLPPDEPKRGGVYGLWLAVTTDAAIHYVKYHSRIAEQFIFDRGNPFFQFVCERLEYESDAMREAIRRAATRYKGGYHG